MIHRDDGIISNHMYLFTVSKKNYVRKYTTPISIITFENYLRKEK